MALEPRSAGSGSNRRTGSDTRATPTRLLTKRYGSIKLVKGAEVPPRTLQTVLLEAKNPRSPYKHPPSRAESTMETPDRSLPDGASAGVPPSVTRRRFLRAVLSAGSVGAGFAMLEGRALAENCSAVNNCGANTCSLANNCGPNTCGPNSCNPNTCSVDNICDPNICNAQNLCGDHNNVSGCGASGNICTPNRCTHDNNCATNKCDPNQCYPNRCGSYNTCVGSNNCNGDNTCAILDSVGISTDDATIAATHRSRWMSRDTLLKLGAPTTDDEWM